jgi:hypothetical protein
VHLGIYCVLVEGAALYVRVGWAEALVMRGYLGYNSWGVRGYEM